MRAPSFPLTRKNHFKFGYNGKIYVHRSEKTDQFFVQYGKSQRTPTDFRSECLRAATEIQNSYPNRKIYLCLSGGIDSEVMLKSFSAAQIPFRVIIARFNRDRNIQDTSWAVLLCENLQIEYEFFDLNVESFFESRFYEAIAEQSRTVYPMLTVAMALMEYVVKNRNGLPVMGSGEFLLEKNCGKIFHIDSEQIVSLYTYLRQRGLPGVPAFFQWSPELMESALRDPLVSNWIQSPSLEFLPLKHLVYDQYFHIFPRPKYFGFEKFANLVASKAQILLLRRPHSTACSAQEYFHFLDHLRQNLQSKTGLFDSQNSH